MLDQKSRGRSLFLANEKAVPPPPQKGPVRRPAYHEVVERVATLEQAPVFGALPDRTLRALARRMRRVTIGEGETVLFQGEPGDTIFFIRQGRCRVVLEQPPNTVTVAVLAAGDFFGESACVLDQPQPASVVTVTDCTLLALDRTSLYSVIGQDPTMLEELAKVATERGVALSDSASHAGWGMVQHRATVVCMYAPKGGSGATTLAVNLVGVLARRFPGQVLLLDLDLPFAHSALLAGLVPTSCLARIASAPPDTFEELLLSTVLYHSSGPMILPGALRPEEADEITPALVSRAIDSLRKTFRYIVVDLSASVSDSMLAMLELAQHVVVITGPDVSSVKSSADTIDILRRLDFPDGRVIIALNNRTPKPAIERSAVERLFRRPVDIVVGYDADRPDQAALKGEILSLTNPASELTKACETLADILDRQQPLQPAEVAAAESGQVAHA